MSDLVNESNIEIAVKKVVLQEILRCIKEASTPHIKFCESISEMRKEANDKRNFNLSFCERELQKILIQEDIIEDIIND